MKEYEKPSMEIIDLQKDDIVMETSDGQAYEPCLK